MGKRSDFMQEFKQMKQAGGAPKITEEVEKDTAAVAKAKDEELKATGGTEEMDEETKEMYKQAGYDIGKTLGEAARESEQTLGQAAEAVQQEDKTKVPEKTVPEKKIRIGTKEFANADEALAYAQELDAIQQREEAFKQGQESVKPKPEPVVEQKKIKKVAELMFENPEAAMELLEQIIEETADKKVADFDNQKTAKAEQIKRAETTWETFYTSNKDLSDFKDEVNFITKREWHRLEHMKESEGLAEIAKLSRAYIASLKEKMLPRQELPSKTVQSPAGGTQSTTTTSKPATPKFESFASQVRSLNKRTVLQDEA